MNKQPSLGHHGTEEWYLQRLSAIVLLLLSPLVLWFVVAVAHGQLDQATIIYWLSSTLARLAHSAFAVAVLTHAYIGLKIILEDYIHQASYRTLLLGLMQVLIVLVFIFWLAHIWV